MKQITPKQQAIARSVFSLLIMTIVGLLLFFCSCESGITNDEVEKTIDKRIEERLTIQPLPDNIDSVDLVVYARGELYSITGLVRDNIPSE